MDRLTPAEQVVVRERVHGFVLAIFVAEWSGAPEGMIEGMLRAAIDTYGELALSVALEEVRDMSRGVADRGWS